MSESDDFFGGGAKSASFKGQPGITWAGVIDRIGSKVQKREYTGDGSLGALKCYPGTSDPIWQLPVTILTDVRDPAVPNDDGRRTIYFEGTKRKALQEALRAAGLRGPVLGDYLALQFYATEQGKGEQPKKLYRAQYSVNPNPNARGEGYVPADAPPAASPQQAVDFFGGGQQQAQQAQAQPTWDQQVQNSGPAPAFAQSAPTPVPAQAAQSPFAPVGAPAPQAANWPPAGATPAPAVPAQAVAPQQPAPAPQAQPATAGAPGRPWGQ